jgi:hypothetical protein
VKAALGCVILFGTVLVPAGWTAPANTTRQRIVALAALQIGYREPGDYCTKFGPCEEWCSLFVTWVWGRIGGSRSGGPLAG